MIYCFGDFRLDTGTGLLKRQDGEVVVLRRQAYRLLLLLLQRAPELVARDTLLDEVWGRQALSPNALPQTISELRQALGDEARHSRYIETRHGVGYRLCVPVESDAPAAVPSLPHNTKPAPQLPWRTMGLTALAAALALGLFLSRPQINENHGPPQAQLETLRRQVEVARQQQDVLGRVAHLQALAVLEPDRVQTRIELAEAQFAALQGEAARRTMALLSARDVDRDSPQWLLLEARQAEADGQQERAMDWLRAAREQALAVADAEALGEALRRLARLKQSQGRLLEAETLLRSSLEQRLLADRDATRIEFGLLLQANLREQGRHSEARTVLDGLVDAALTPAQSLRLRIEHALIAGLDGGAGSAWQALLDLEPQALQQADPELHIALGNALGTVGVEVGEYDRALAAFERALAGARRIGAGQQVAATQINAGAMLARRDRFAEAERLWGEAQAVFEALGDRRGVAIALSNLAAAASAQGQNPRSIELNRQALSLFRELELPVEQARAAFNLALVASREGRLGEALNHLQESRRAYAESGRAELEVHVAAVEADHLLLAGATGDAESLLLGVMPRLGEASPLRQAGIHASLGRLALAQGRYEAAEAEFERARRLREESAQDTWIATSELELLQLDVHRGREPLQARVRALELADVFRARAQTRASLRAALVAAEALLWLEQPERASQEIERLREQAVQFPDMALKLDLDWVDAFIVSGSDERSLRLQALARRAESQGFEAMAERCRAWLGSDSRPGITLPGYAQRFPPP